MYFIPNKPLELTFDWLFNKIAQEDVFLRYFGFCELNKKYCNPFRKDRNPDCSFYWHQGTLFFKDFALNKAYTCVSVVMEINKLNYYEALEQIYQEFIGLKGNNFVITKIDRPIQSKEYKHIEVKIQPFTTTDIIYLKQYGITKEFTKKAKWFSIKHYWIDGDLKYTYSNFNPCIGYYFPKQNKWKLYFYLNKDWRFISNVSYDIIQGWDILPETGNNLIITKSFKDIGTLYEQNIPAIAPQAESILLPKNVIDELKQRFINIYSLMDYDNTGIHLAWQMRKLYNIKPLFFTDKLWNRKGGYLNAKDCSDYRKLYGFNKLNELIQNTNGRI